MNRPNDGQPTSGSNYQPPFADNQQPYAGSQPHYEPYQQPYPGSQQSNPEPQEIRFTEATGQPPTGFDPSQQYYQQPPAPSNNGKLWAIGGGVLVLLIVVIVGAVLIFSGDDSDSKGSSDPAQFAKDFVGGVVNSNGAMSDNQKNMVCPDSPLARQLEAGQNAASRLSKTSMSGIKVDKVTIGDAKVVNTSDESTVVKLTITTNVTISLYGQSTSTSQHVNMQATLKKNNGSWCLNSINTPTRTR